MRVKSQKWVANTSANRSVQHVAQLNVTCKDSISSYQTPAKPLNKLFVS